MLPGQHCARKKNADHITNFRLQITHQHQDSLVCADIHQYLSRNINFLPIRGRLLLSFIKHRVKVKIGVNPVLFLVIKPLYYISFESLESLFFTFE